MTFFVYNTVLSCLCSFFSFLFFLLDITYLFHQTYIKRKTGNKFSDFLNRAPVWAPLLCLRLTGRQHPRLFAQLAVPTFRGSEDDNSVSGRSPRLLPLLWYFSLWSFLGPWKSAFWPHHLEILTFFLRALRIPLSAEPFRSWGSLLLFTGHWPAVTQLCVVQIPVCRLLLYRKIQQQSPPSEVNVYVGHTYNL